MAGTGNAAVPPVDTGAEVAAYDLMLELIDEGKRLADARAASLQW
ncbi:hypothetical protein OL239_01195 [Arthrobacter sp. ATA002]|nr:hypothetical protein [Arthrobacter sp. ATA002]WAP51984.1 hypothetical protein OL239_01195 [Arthrobacter sp. ATA002]